jgi:outer membrane protein assembly factor BamB
MKRAGIVALAGLLLGSGMAAQNWPSFRGERASGVADGAPAPEKWDVAKNENVLWKVAIPGLSVASPIVWRDRVIVVTAVSSDSKNETLRHGLYGDVDAAADMSAHTWKVMAFDKRSGKLAWERIAALGVPKSKRHTKASQANSTPATDGKYIVAFFGSEGLYTYDWNGKLVWKKDLGNLSAGWFYDPDYEWGTASSPIIYKNMVIVQVDVQKDSFLAAYDIKSGKELWKTMRDEIPSWSTPTVYEHKDGRAEIITHATKFIRGYDAMTGKELWKLGPNSEVCTPTPFVAHDLIYVTNGYRFIQPIYAIKPGGAGDLTLAKDQTKSDFIAWSTQRGGPYMPTPVVYGDLFYTTNNSGILTVLNARTGERAYQQRLGAGGAYTASVIAGDGKIFFTSEDGDVYVVKAGDKYELLAKNAVGEVLMATPALSDGVLYIRSIKSLIAVGMPAPPPGAKPAGKASKAAGQ